MHVLYEKLEFKFLAYPFLLDSLAQRRLIACFLYDSRFQTIDDFFDPVFGTAQWTYIGDYYTSRLIEGIDVLCECRRRIVFFDVHSCYFILIDVPNKVKRSVSHRRTRHIDSDWPLCLSAVISIGWVVLTSFVLYCELVGARIYWRHIW